MCHIFAGQNPDDYAYFTRSVRLAGHATSIRLEAKFWEILDTIASEQEISTPRFLSTLYDEALELRGELTNFSSLLRCAAVLYLEQRGAMIARAREEIELREVG